VHHGYLLQAAKRVERGSEVAGMEAAMRKLQAEVAPLFPGQVCGREQVGA